MYSGLDVERMSRLVIQRGGFDTRSDLWVANWGVSSPAPPPIWKSWTFWQYSASGSVPGINGSPGVDVSWQQWEAPRPGGFRRREDLVAWVRRLLCLPRDRDPEVARALETHIVESDGVFALPDRPVVTTWWRGGGRD